MLRVNTAQGLRRKQSDYSVQLRAKQKLARLLRNPRRPVSGGYYKEGVRECRGVSGEKPVCGLLECRLDNIVYRLGFCAHRARLRASLVRHKPHRGKTANGSIFLPI